VTVDGLGNPLRFILTGGQRNDITQADSLIAGFNCQYVIADKGYDADDLRQTVLDQGATPVIPPRGNRTEPVDYDAWVYRERHLVECFMNKFKHFRRLFSRFDKLDRRFLAFLSFVAALIWLR
jgi:transposase